MLKAPNEYGSAGVLRLKDYIWPQGPVDEAEGLLVLDREDDLHHEVKHLVTAVEVPQHLLKRVLS